jgi:pyridoxal phosphate enzyme (YggS family)
MLPSTEEFSARVDAIRARIAAACQQAGRDPATVELMAVTKTHPPEAALLAAGQGLRSGLRWELIGHLQSNKSRLAAENFDRIQSVDSVKLIRHLARAAAESNRVLAVLLQINAGQDPAKFGAETAEAPALLEAALAEPALRVDGLMTIAPLGATADETAELARRTFDALRTIRDELAARFGRPLPELSMGMTGDLEPAVAAGSTIVRVGTALFGAR